MYRLKLALRSQKVLLSTQESQIFGLDRETEIFGMLDDPCRVMFGCVRVMLTDADDQVFWHRTNKLDLHRSLPVLCLDVSPGRGDVEDL